MRTSPDDIAVVLTHLLNASKQTNLDAFSAVAHHEPMQQALECVINGDYRGFDLAVAYPLRKMLDGLLETALPGKSDAKFILQHSRFIEQQFRSIIEHCEGISCCSDKTRMLVKALLRFYVTGEKIVFDYNQQYTYHLPKKVFVNHDDIVSFYCGARNMYHGQPDDFITAREKQMALAQARDNSEIASPGA